MKFTISTLIALSMAGPAIAKITVSIVTDLASGSLVVKPGGKPIDLSTAKPTTGHDLDPTLKDVTDISFESPNLDDFVRFDIIDNPDSYTQVSVYDLGYGTRLRDSVEFGWSRLLGRITSISRLQRH